MGCSVETVSPNSVFLVELVRQRVYEGFSGHSLMEGGVEDGHMRDIGQKVFRGFYSGQVWGIMQWRQGLELLDGLNHRVVDES